MRQGRVVLADSNQDMLGGIRGLLEKVFEIVVMVADEESLLEAAYKLQPDLAVVDLSLPTSGGLRAARHLTSHHPQLKVIMLSVHDEPAVVKATLAAGAAGFVLKRSAATDLIPAVREVLQGRAYVSPAAGDPNG